MKILKGDEVIITLGKDKGKTGKVGKVLVLANTLVIPGINEFKRHKKAQLQGQSSEIVTITKPIGASKVALLCPKCHKRTRIGYGMEKDKKIRICRKCKAKI